MFKKSTSACSATKTTTSKRWGSTSPAATKDEPEEFLSLKNVVKLELEDKDANILELVEKLKTTQTLNTLSLTISTASTTLRLPLYYL